MKHLTEFINESIFDLPELYEKIEKNDVTLYDLIRGYIDTFSYSHTLGYTHYAGFTAFKQVCKKNRYPKADPFVNAKGKPASAAKDVWKLFAGICASIKVDMKKDVETRFREINKVFDEIQQQVSELAYNAIKEDLEDHIKAYKKNLKESPSDVDWGKYLGQEEQKLKDLETAKKDKEVIGEFKFRASGNEHVSYVWRSYKDGSRSASERSYGNIEGISFWGKSFRGAMYLTPDCPLFMEPKK